MSVKIHFTAAMERPRVNMYHNASSIPIITRKYVWTACLEDAGKQLCN